MQSLRMLTGLLVAATAITACERASRAGDMFDAAAASRPAASEARPAAPEMQPSEPAGVLVPAPAASMPSRNAIGAEPISDATITAKVRRAIAADPALADADVSVNTDHGVVSLAGIVACADQSAIASAHAQREDGVMRIDNHLAMNLR